MRIAIDGSHLDTAGGVRTYITNLLHALTTAEPNHDYSIYSRGPRPPSGAPPLKRGVRARRVHVRTPRRLFSTVENVLGWPPAEYWCGAIDVFHGTHFTLPPTRRARRVLSVMDTIYLRHPEYYEDRRLNEYGYRRLLPHALKRAHRVLAISETTKRDLIELCNVAADRIWVVPLGRDMRFFPSDGHEVAHVLARYQVARPYVIYPMGTLEPRKNLTRVLHALRNAFPRAAERPLLLLTGVGTLSTEMRETIERLELARDVHWIHAKYPDELRALMTGALWGIYASLYEGFGLPALEMLACGLPTVVSAASAVPEVVGDAALLAEPTDLYAIAAGMERLHLDEALRARLRARALARANAPAFQWGRVAQQTFAAYRDDYAAYAAEPMPSASAEEIPATATTAPPTLVVVE
ncbi:MAG: glycosyltransferase family 4 protein [Planctomycetota bacterium]